MLLIAIVVLPALAAAAAYMVADRGRRSALLVAAAALHLALVAALWLTPDRSAFDGWLAVDALGLVVLSLQSVLFAAVASYALGFLRTEKPGGGRAFLSCLLVFLCAVSLVCVSQHLAVMWVGMEATTLAVAPLVFHRRDRRSLEAGWKYLMLSSVGIAFARFTQVSIAAGQAGFVRPLLVAFGLLSIAVATVFILGQSDIKRLLAYSSVEHMGLLALGLGIGGAGAYGAVLHALNNGLLKRALFLVVGNLVLAANTSVVAGMKGMLRRRPVSAALLVAGLFAVSGTPPFGLFISEYSIIAGAVHQDRRWIATVRVVPVSVIFVVL